MLFLLKTRSLLSVVQINCVSGFVDELPERDHPPFCQLALPEASVVRTYPLDAPVVRRNPENDHVHTTSRRYAPVLVPIPTLPVDQTLILLFPSPSAMMMLLDRFDARPITLAPRMVFPDPVVIHLAVLYPRAVLLAPVVLSKSDTLPILTLFDPVLLE